MEEQEKVLEGELNAKTLELQVLEEELHLLKAAADMAFDQNHPIESYLEQLNEQVNAKSHNIANLKLQWYDVTIYYNRYTHGKIHVTWTLSSNYAWN